MRNPKLENCVCVELMRQGKDIYYHADTQECDSIMCEGVTIVEAMQVTVSIKDAGTREREIRGPLASMERYESPMGTIITLEEEITVNAHQHISVHPIWKWLL